MIVPRLLIGTHERNVGPNAISSQEAPQSTLPEQTTVVVVNRAGLTLSKLELEVASTLSSGLLASSSSTTGRNASQDPSSIEGDGPILPNATDHDVLHAHKSTSPTPVAFAGALTQINGMHGAYVKDSMRNAELWNFCKSASSMSKRYVFTDKLPVHHFVVPNMCSVDGSTTPTLFVKEMLPWMIQSPLMPHIAILMSAASQAAEPNLQTTGALETIVIKSQVLSLINEFLRQDFSVVGGEALRTVIHLVVIEVCYVFGFSR